MLLKACRRCGNLIPYGHDYCNKCQPIIDRLREEAKKESNKKYNQTRDKKYIRFYNSNEWRVLSSKYTMDHAYRCEHCGAIATQVHHKQAIQTEEGWARRLDYTNLELLCTQCHNDRHNRFKRRKKRK